MEQQRKTDPLADLPEGTEEVPESFYAELVQISVEQIFKILHKNIWDNLIPEHQNELGKICEKLEIEFKSKAISEIYQKLNPNSETKAKLDQIRKVFVRENIIPHFRTLTISIFLISYKARNDDRKKIKLVLDSQEVEKIEDVAKKIVKAVSQRKDFKLDDTTSNIKKYFEEKFPVVYSRLVSAVGSSPIEKTDILRYFHNLDGFEWVGNFLLLVVEEFQKKQSRQD